MVPMNERLPRYVALTVFAAMIAWAGWAGAAVLSPDPDFGAQTLGSPIGSPWNPVSGSGNAASAGAQSPFTDAFPDNGIGANTPATAGNPYFVGTFSSIIPAAATGQLYFNADFRNNSADGGDYSMVITNGANGAVRTAALYVTGGALYAEGGGGTGLPILTLKPNTWYNVQLTLDLTSNTYSGKVTEHGWTTTNISSRPFLTENPINCIYSDGGTSLIGGAAPNHDIDNFALSDTPLGSPPLIATRTNIVNIDFNGVRNTPGPDVPGPTYSGSGAAGGGIVFNGIPADSRLTFPNDFDNLTVGATDLLDSDGNPTAIDFTVSPVGGDVGGPPTTDPTSPEALFSDYVFDHSAGNTSDSPFTISGLGLAMTADLYFYHTSPDATITVDGATPAPFVGYGIFYSGNTLFFPNVPIVNGTISGHFGNGMTAVIEGLTIVTYNAPVPEPSTGVLLLVGLVGLPWLSRRRLRAGKARRAGA
jgi:hypothetical protein